MNHVDPDIADLFKSSRQMGIYFRLAVDPPLRLWCGANDAPANMKDIDVGDQLYLGAGLLKGIGQFDVLISGLADRADIVLDGVSPTTVQEIEELNPDVVGKAVHIGLAAHDSEWQVLSPIIPLTEGMADYWALTQEIQRGSDQKTFKLALSVGFGDTNRSRPRRVTYTAAQQKLLFPLDEICRNVAKYNSGYVATWPRFK